MAPPPRTRARKERDQGTPEPMFPTQETAMSVETALSQGEHQDPYPTMVQRIADLLCKPQELMERQREDSHLLGRIRDLDNRGTGGEYVTDDDGLLRYAPSGYILRLAIPRSLVPGVLAFVHTTYGHPGVARTTELTQTKYHWTSLKSDVRDYVLSCGYRRLKRSISQRVAMLPARFLKSRKVLEMDIHDMGARSEAGNEHLLVIVDRVGKFLFAYSLPNKTAENVAKKLLVCAVDIRDTLVSAQLPRRGVHCRGCPTPLYMAQCGDRLWPYRPPEGSRSCRKVGGVDP